VVEEIGKGAAGTDLTGATVGVGNSGDEGEGWPEMVKLAEKSEKMSLHNEGIGVF